MTAIVELRLSDPFEALFEKRLVMNDVIRFLLVNPPEKNYYLVLLNDCAFQSLAETNTHAKMIDKEIRAFRARPDKLRKALNEYTKLFDTEELLLASSLIPQHRKAGTDTVAALKKLYKEYGLAIKLPQGQNEDHIAVELEFLSYLIRLSFERNDPGELRKILKEQQNFYSLHLEKWVNELCSVLNSSSIHPLYEALAGLMQDYFKLESETCEYIAQWLNEQQTLPANH